MQTIDHKQENVHKSSLSEFRSLFLSEVSHPIDLKAEQMTSRTKILTVKAVKSLKLKKSMVARTIDEDDEKNIAGQVLT